METRFCPGTELLSGDVVIDDEGNELEVAFTVLEGGRNHVAFAGGCAEDVVLTEDDVVEVRCGPGMED